jgi:hypothetical protein
MLAFETLAIASPIMRFVGTSVMPGLFFQPISLVRIDPVPVASTTAILRSGFTALAALVFKPRPVIDTPPSVDVAGQRSRLRFLQHLPTASSS